MVDLSSGTVWVNLKESFQVTQPTMLQQCCNKSIKELTAQDACCVGVVLWFGCEWIVVGWVECSFLCELCCELL